jgi:hypothetical protein
MRNGSKAYRKAIVYVALQNRNDICNLNNTRKGDNLQSLKIQKNKILEFTMACNTTKERKKESRKSCSRIKVSRKS